MPRVPVRSGFVLRHLELEPQLAVFQCLRRVSGSWVQCRVFRALKIWDLRLEELLYQKKILCRRVKSGFKELLKCFSAHLDKILPLEECRSPQDGVDILLHLKIEEINAL
jgi:hypothetical protein